MNNTNSNLGNGQLVRDIKGVSEDLENYFVKMTTNSNVSKSIESSSMHSGAVGSRDGGGLPQGTAAGSATGGATLIQKTTTVKTETLSGPISAKSETQTNN